MIQDGYWTHRGVTVRCGGCGAQKSFPSEVGPGDVLARKAGWTIQHAPRPTVRCPDCALLSKAPSNG